MTLASRNPQCVERYNSRLHEWKCSIPFTRLRHPGRSNTTFTQPIRRGLRCGFVLPLPHPKQKSFRPLFHRFARHLQHCFDYIVGSIIRRYNLDLHLGHQIYNIGVSAIFFCSPPLLPIATNIAHGHSDNAYIFQSDFYFVNFDRAYYTFNLFLF